MTVNYYGISSLIPRPNVIKLFTLAITIVIFFTTWNEGSIVVNYKCIKFYNISPMEAVDIMRLMKIRYLLYKHA